jgi:hypothetical protein
VRDSIVQQAVAQLAELGEGHSLANSLQPSSIGYSLAYLKRSLSSNKPFIFLDAQNSSLPRPTQKLTSDNLPCRKYILPDFYDTMLEYLEDSATELCNNLLHTIQSKPKLSLKADFPGRAGVA